jgi:DNA-3-methyladenine glycosylase I
MVAYHDDEWGVPTHDDAALFELLTLEGAQAGLSWRTILGKRAGYRSAFAEFDPARVATYTADDIERLVADPSIVRHRGQIESTVENARRILEVQAEQAASTPPWGFPRAT